MKMKSIIYTVIVLFFLTSCEKDLDFKYHSIDPIPVIEGELGPDGVRIAITLTTPMDEPMDLTRLTDAEVILDNLGDGTSVILRADNDGYFRDKTTGIPGNQYRLNVELEGKHYDTTTMMYSPVEILAMEFNWIKMPYDHVAVLQVVFTDNPETRGDCYWVKLFKNGKIYKWMQIDDRGADTGFVTYTTMTSRMDTDEEDAGSALFDGDVMTCTVSPISKQMYDYLAALQNDSSGPAMFDGDFCLGYFMATTTVSRSITFHPDIIPIYKKTIK